MRRVKDIPLTLKDKNSSEKQISEMMNVGNELKESAKIDSYETLI